MYIALLNAVSWVYPMFLGMQQLHVWVNKRPDGQWTRRRTKSRSRRWSSNSPLPSPSLGDNQSKRRTWSQDDLGNVSLGKTQSIDDDSLNLTTDSMAGPSTSGTDEVPPTVVNLCLCFVVNWVVDLSQYLCANILMLPTFDLTVCVLHLLLTIGVLHYNFGHWLYQSYVEPLIREHEEQLESTISSYVSVPDKTPMAEKSDTDEESETEAERSVRALMHTQTQEGDPTSGITTAATSELPKSPPLYTQAVSTPRYTAAEPVSVGSVAAVPEDAEPASVGAAAVPEDVDQSRTSMDGISALRSLRQRPSSGMFSRRSATGTDATQPVRRRTSHIDIMGDLMKRYVKGGSTSDTTSRK